VVLGGNDRKASSRRASGLSSKKRKKKQNGRGAFWPGKERHGEGIMLPEPGGKVKGDCPSKVGSGLIIRKEGMHGLKDGHLFLFE